MCECLTCIQKLSSSRLSLSQDGRKKLKITEKSTPKQKALGKQVLETFIDSSIIIITVKLCVCREHRWSNPGWIHGKLGWYYSIVSQLCIFWNGCDNDIHEQRHRFKILPKVEFAPLWRLSCVHALIRVIVYYYNAVCGAINICCEVIVSNLQYLLLRPSRGAEYCYQFV